MPGCAQRVPENSATQAQSLKSPPLGPASFSRHVPQVSRHDSKAQVSSSPLTTQRFLLEPIHEHFLPLSRFLCHESSSSHFGKIGPGATGCLVGALVGALVGSFVGGLVG